MKRIFSALLIMICCCQHINAQQIPSRPSPPKLVNDIAGVLTADQVQTLETKLVAYDDSTSTQIVVITVKSTEGYDVQEYALKILRDWGIGNKKTNNGIVILAAIEDRKVRIEVGYGMEGVIPDAIAKRIIEDEIKPNFANNQFYRGFDEATNAIIKAAAGEYKAPEGYNKKIRRKGGGSLLFPLIIMIIVLIIISRSGGGSSGGMMSRRGYRGFFGPTIWLPGSGGGWGGNDSGSGGWSGGGGGFGGFGGGSGGGGGASGSW
jgi:uncharacterized protein